MTQDELLAIYEEEVRRVTDLIVFLLRMMPLSNNLITVKLAPFYEYREGLVNIIKGLKGATAHEQLNIVSSQDSGGTSAKQPIHIDRFGPSRFSFDYYPGCNGDAESDGDPGG